MVCIKVLASMEIMVSIVIDPVYMLNRKMPVIHMFVMSRSWFWGWLVIRMLVSRCMLRCLIAFRSCLSPGFCSILRLTTLFPILICILFLLFPA